MEHKVEVDNTANLLLIDGVPYVTHKYTSEKLDGITHTRKTIYRKASKKEIKQIINKVVNKLKSKTSKEELLREIISKKYNMSYLLKLGKEIDKGGKIKKHKGCLGFLIGKKYVQLI